MFHNTKNTGILVKNIKDEFNNIKSQYESFFIRAELGAQIKDNAILLLVADKNRFLSELVEAQNSLAKENKDLYALNRISEKLKLLDNNSLISNIFSICQNTDLQTMLQTSSQNITPAQSINVLVNLRNIQIIITLLKNHDLLTSKNIELLMTAIKANNLSATDSVVKIVRMTKSLNSLATLNLLNDSNYSQLMTETYIDKSCLARTTVTHFDFFGNASKDVYENKIMWSYYCNGIETNIVKMINENKSMEEIFVYVRDARGEIAILRGEDKSFGQIRDDESVDVYTQKRNSVANPMIFEEIVKLVTPFIHDDSSKISTEQLPYGVIKRLMNFEHEITAKDGSAINFPKETIIILTETVEGEERVQGVRVCFHPFEIKHFQAMLHEGDELLEDMRGGKYDFQNGDSQRFLRHLGMLTYCMSRFYPLQRGSGAVLQCIIRGIVRAYTKELLDLGDIRLGTNSDKNKNVPYDIYAQIVQNPYEYGEAFMQALQPELEQARKLKPAVQP